MTGSSDSLFASRVRAVAAAEKSRFTELVKLAGLDPRRDFRHADLSGADLRGEDLRGFDLSYAVLDGARVLGARFNHTVRPRHLRGAIRSARAMVVLVGEPLLSDEAHIGQRLGEDVYLPQPLNEALRRSEQDSQRRNRVTGSFIGDNSDLIRRRLGQAMKVAGPAVHGVCFVVAEPETDFDFDALGVVLGAMDRHRQKPFVFLLPHTMATEESGERIVRARVRGLSPSNLVNFVGTIERRGTHVKHATRLAHQALADRMTVLDFILALSNSRVVHQMERRSHRYSEESPPWLVRGTRKAREPLISAILRATEASQPANSFGTLTRGVLLRADVPSDELPSQLAATFSQTTSVCHVGTFPRRAGDESEFYVVSGPPDSNIWNAFRNAPAPEVKPSR